MSAARRQAILRAVSIGLLISLPGLSGCKPDPAIAAQKAQAEAEKAQAESDAAKKAAALQEQEKVMEQAKTDLANRIRLFLALAGDYVARGSGPEGLTFESRIRLHVDNIPTDYIVGTATTEAEVRALADGLTLTGDAQDRWADSDLRIVFCTASNIKPDFYAGSIRLVCTTPGAGGSRVYGLGFEYNDASLDLVTSESVMASRNRSVSEDLIRGKIDRVDAYDLTIMGGEIELSGKLRRLPAD